MAFVKVRIPRTSQPQGLCGVDADHPIVEHLHKVFVTGLPETVSGTVPTRGLPVSATRDGVAITNTSGTGVYEWATNASPQTSEATVVIRAMRAGAQPDGGFGAALRLVQVSGTQDPFQLFIKDSGERIRWNTTTSDNANSVETTTNWPIGEWQTGAYVWIAGSNAICYRNGVSQTLSLNTLGVKTGVLKPAISASINLSSLRLNGAVSLVLVFSRALYPSEIKSISDNPWQIFEPEEQWIWVPDDAGAGVSSVYSDIATAFNVRGAAQIDLATSYNLRNSASQDISPAFNVRVAAPADLSLAYTLRGAASQDITSAFSVRGAVPIDLSPAFNVRGLIQIDESASYSIRGAVSADITPGYSIMNAGVVASDLITSYQVRGIAQGDMAATYNLRGSTQGDLANSYVIRGAVSADMSASYTVAGSVATVQTDLTVNYSVLGVAAACPTAADIAAAVRADLSAELARIDAAISSRSTVAAIMGYDE